jgi:hypothetical protein
MQETFKEIEREISTLKIEIKAKHNSQVGLFGNEQESIFSINSYVHAGNYRKHMCKISNKARLAIEAEHDLCEDHASALYLLERHHLYLCELRKMYLPKNKNFILDAVESGRPISTRYTADYSEIMKKKALYFSEIQKAVVRDLEAYLKQKIKSTELHIRLFQAGYSPGFSKPFKFKNTEQLELFEQDTKRSPKLFWTRTDTDLIELITALRNLNAIKSEDGNLTMKQFLEIFEVLLNRPIKGASVKLSKIKYRKGRPVVFLQELSESILNDRSRNESSD